MAILAACDGGAPIQRGFGSRQLVSLRDVNLGPGGWVGSTWVYSTSYGYWSLDMDTGAVANLGPDRPDPMFRPTNARYSCEFASDGNLATITVTDAQSGQMTVIDRVAATIACPSEPDATLTLWRADERGKLTLWTGRYDQLAVVSLDVDIHDVGFAHYAADIADSGFTVYGFTVFASRPSQPDAVGIFALDPPAFTAREIVPAALTSAAWADGAPDQRPPLVSTRVAPQWAVPHGSLDRLIYLRILSDGSSAAFEGLFPSQPTEVALFPIDPSADLRGLQILTVPPAMSLPSVAWRSRSRASGADTLITWGNERHLSVCPSPFPSDFLLATAIPGGDSVVFAKLPTEDFTDVPADNGPLLLMGAGSCTTLAPAHVSDFTVSPDGSAIAWRTESLPGDATLWAAAGDGTNVRMIGSGEIAGRPLAPRFVGPGALELALAQDLVWIDLDGGLDRLHYIAERVFGTAIDLGGKLVTGYDFSVQDATGTLGLIDRQTGDKQLISREVASFTVVGPRPTDLPLLPGSNPAGGPVQILYVVRGRNSSAQDGLWIATIDPAAGN